MRVPSLRRRVILLGMSIVGLVVLVVDVALTLPLADEFEAVTEEVLDARAALASQLVADGTTGEELARALAERGVPAIVTTDDGREVVATPDGEDPTEGTAQRSLALPDGSAVELLASRSERTTVRRFLLTAVAGSLVAVAGSLVLFELLVRLALRPLDEVVEAARATARGRTGERLHPERTDTEIGRLAEAFDEMLDAQEAALDQAHAAEERSQRFLADAAHQLRTPVAGLRASAEALVTGRAGVERDHLLVHLARESARTGRLLDDLLTVAHLDRGRELAADTLDLAALAASEADRLRTRRPDLDVVTVDAGRAEVVGDEAGLREAIANLLDNAGRHARARVEVQVAVAPGRGVGVRVADDGPGLDLDQVEVVFDRFVSLDDAGGSGLGLPIARGIARAHGGDVRWLEDAFVLTLPASDAAADVEGTAPHPA
ncbi:HAMP domain-containing histidine kinase [Nitriliruptoraceae bacterium ZYF776]|nr:HAMP domain-containing histidine kinase [Profundirhabdus halotolerans]